MAYFGAAYYGRSYFGNAYWGTGTGETVQRGDWQIYYQDEKGRRKRWKQELLDRDELRRIIRAAVLGEVPAVAEFVEPQKPPADTSRVNAALAPKQDAMPFIDYDAIMGDMVALQRILSWHYKRQVEIARADDDDDAVIMLMM